MTEITMTVDENDQLTLNFLLIAKFFSFLFFFFLFFLSAHYFGFLTLNSTTLSD